MVRLNLCSGRDCVKILCKHFGFREKRQKGSHIVLEKVTARGRIVTVVPNHRELKIKTLKSALRLAQVAEEAFVQYQ